MVSLDRTETRCLSQTDGIVSCPAVPDGVGEHRRHDIADLALQSRAGGFAVQFLELLHPALNIDAFDRRKRHRAPTGHDVVVDVATKILEGLQVFPKGGLWSERTMPEQDNDQGKLLLLGQIMEMMLYKEQRYGVPLPPIFDELKSAGLQLGPVRPSQ